LRRSVASSGTASLIRRGSEPIVAVILAGGAGTRLWPLANATQPKPFLPLLRGRSLFQETCRRITPVGDRRSILVVAGEQHQRWIRRQAPWLPPDRLILEGVGRGTAAAVALAALRIRQNLGDGVMIVLPADHWIEPAASLRSTLRRAIGAVESMNGLVTIGIPVRSADTGFGYVLPSGRPVAPGVRRAARFVEKPGPGRAERMARSGRFVWNSGIFVWRASTILEEIERHRADVLRPLQAWLRRATVRGTWRVPNSVLRRVPALPIDRAVLERSHRVLVARGTFRWSDLGTWDALAAHLTKDRHGNSGIGRRLTLDADGCLTVNEGGLNVLVGVRDLVVVRTKDVVLVCKRHASQRIRDVVARLHGRRGASLQRVRT
jgi:mannose-1-phosphate guanylyltransferase/mannose-6-phosphate isomerase